ncbi:hypothetical protein BH23BAC1_BH23BAC1_31420 [soil metagenome]
MRNPKWKRDELILALDLYYNNNYNELDKKSKFIINEICCKSFYGSIGY